MTPVRVYHMLGSLCYVLSGGENNLTLRPRPPPGNNPGMDLQKSDLGGAGESQQNLKKNMTI